VGDVENEAALASYCDFYSEIIFLERVARNLPKGNSARVVARLKIVFI
jgi:hypothetical protein